MSIVETVCTRKRKHNTEIEEANDYIFDSVFNFFMDFADKAETIVPVEPSEPEEGGGGGGEEEVEVPLGMFEKLQVEDQEDVIKEVFGEIVWNLLGKLPKEGKEAFLGKCFKELLNKLPRLSQVEIYAKVKERSSTLLIKETTRPATFFPTDDLIEVGYQPKRLRAQRRGVVRDNQEVRNDRYAIPRPPVVRDDGRDAGNGHPGQVTGNGNTRGRRGRR